MKVFNVGERTWGYDEYNLNKKSKNSSGKKGKIPVFLIKADGCDLAEKCLECPFDKYKYG